MHKILIASDRIAVRTYLQKACEEHGFSVCGEATTPEQVLISSNLHLPDVIIFNFQSVIRIQTSIISQIIKIHKNTSVLVYSSSGPNRSTQAYIRAGASGFLCEKCHTHELISILHGLFAGFKIFPMKALKQPKIKLAHRPSSLNSLDSLPALEK